MASAFSRSLLPGESVVFRTGLHWIVLVPSLVGLLLIGILVAALLLLLGAIPLPESLQVVDQALEVASVKADEFGSKGLEYLGTGFRFGPRTTIPVLGGTILGLVLLCWWLSRVLAYAGSEFAVTNKRVLLLGGLIRRGSVELNLNRIEGVVVNQRLRGRLLDYGTLVVMGVGGTKETFPLIRSPLTFRQRLQEQIAAHP